MNLPTSAFDERETNALGYQTIQNLSDLPPLSDEVLENFGNSPIWDEMLGAGLISKKQTENLTRCCGGILKDLIEKEIEGRRRERPWWLWTDILHVPGIGPAQLLDIGNFIRATYGYSPSYFDLENERSSFAPPESEADFSGLDVRLTDQLAQPLDLGSAQISEQAQQLLSEHNIHTVGEFVVLSSAMLREKGLTTAMIKRVETAIEAQTGFVKSGLVKNKVATQAVRWKYAVMKAQGFAEAPE